MRYALVLVLSMVLLVPSMSWGDHELPDPLDVLLLVDFSSPPANAYLDTESVLEASSSFLTELASRAKENSRLRIHPFAQQLGTIPIWNKPLDRTLDTGAVLRRIKDAMAGSDYPLEPNIGIPRYTDLVRVLTQVNGLKADSDAHFPVLVIISNGIDDHNDTQRCSHNPDAVVSKRRKELDEAIRAVRRRTVLFMTPCSRSEGYPFYPPIFGELWAGVRKDRKSFLLVHAWGPAGSGRTPETEAPDAVAFLKPAAHLSLIAPARIYAPGPVGLEIHTDVSEVGVVACVNHHPENEKIRDALAYVTLGPHDTSSRCHDLRPASGRPGKLLMQFRPDGKIARHAGDDPSALGFRVDLAPGPDAVPRPPQSSESRNPSAEKLRKMDFDAAVFPSVFHVLFRYEWPCWWLSLLFHPATLWAAVALGMTSLAVLGILTIQRYVPLLPRAWILGCQLFDPKEGGESPKPRTELKPVFPVGMIPPASWYGGGSYELRLHEWMQNLGPRGSLYKASEAIEVWRSGDRETVMRLAAGSTAQVDCLKRVIGSQTAWRRLGRGQRLVLSSSASTRDTLVVKPRVGTHPGEAVELDLLWNRSGDRIARVTGLIFFHPMAKACRRIALLLSVAYFVFTVSAAWYWNLSDQVSFVTVRASIPVVVGTTISVVRLPHGLAALRAGTEFLWHAVVEWFRHHGA